MRNATFLISIALTLAGCGATNDDSHSAVAVLEAANAAKDRAMVAGDPAVLDNFYTADYQVIDSNGAVHDKADQVDFMTRQVDLVSAASSDVRVRLLSKNAALVTGRVAGKYRQDGRLLPFDDRFTSVWVSEDSQWRVRHEHSSELK